MKINNWQQLNQQQQQQLLMRPAVADSKRIDDTVREIIVNVRNNGDTALKQLSAQFDKVELNTLMLSTQAINAAAERLSEQFKQAINNAINNIEKFHLAQKNPIVEVETQPGVYCQQVTRPIQSVGLYIPGGSAPLFSTVLMLAIPAKIAQCQQVILCSPPPIADEILYAASVCGIDKIYQIGGAQAIAAMAFGSDSITKVDKIFGPGNAYVTEAKRQVSQMIGGAAIDMPAGPSEVLVIADQFANPAFIAADLLSQAEHGPDSQVILLTPDIQLAQQVAIEVDRQLQLLPRNQIATQALKQSRLIVTESIEQCIAISNQYGPEHLMIQTENAEQWVQQITNAGSVFLGAWSPESAGDYASGTNHVLPTYGYTATYSSLGLADFQKRMTIQKITPQGLRKLGPTVEILAAAEQLIAHKMAVTLRLVELEQQE